jgi:hypothetical protein
MKKSAKNNESASTDAIIETAPRGFGDYVIVFKSGATVTLTNVGLAATFYSNQTGKSSEWLFFNEKREVVNIATLSQPIIPVMPQEAEPMPPNNFDPVQGFASKIDAIIKIK